MEPKGVTEECVKFFDVGRRVGINIVPFSKLEFCPRVGEIVELPGEGGHGAGSYDVVGVYHTFVPDLDGDNPSPAKALSVRIDVKRR